MRLFLLLVITATTWAAPISFFSTGSGFTEGQTDTHWTLTSAPSGVGSSTFVTVSDGYPLGTWALNSTTLAGDKWIQGISGTTDLMPGGTYIFSQSFDLSSFIASTAQITFTAYVDDNIISVKLNGTPVGFNLISGFTPFFGSPSAPFTISNGTGGATFLPGMNTISFEVFNCNTPTTTCSINPSGLRVAVSSATATLAPTSAVPEPASLGMLAAGLSVLALRWCRK